MCAVQCSLLQLADADVWLRVCGQLSVNQDGEVLAGWRYSKPLFPAGVWSRGLMHDARIPGMRGRDLLEVQSAIGKGPMRCLPPTQPRLHAYGRALV